MASQSAYNQAKKNLGNLDLSAYDKLYGQLKTTADLDRQSLQNTFNTLIEGLEKSRAEGREDFGKSRALIAEGSFDRQRQQAINLAGRGLAGSGLQQLGQVQDRMETGRQVSNVANNFYRTLEDLANKQQKGKESYDLDTRRISENLSTNLARLEGEKADRTMAYNQSVASLAQQIQSAWDAQAAAAAARASARAQSNKEATLADKLNTLNAADAIMKDYAATAKANKGGLPTTQQYENAVRQLRNIGADSYIPNLRNMNTTLAQQVVSANKAQQAKDLKAAYNKQSLTKKGYAAGTGIGLGASLGLAPVTGGLSLFGLLPTLAAGYGAFKN